VFAVAYCPGDGSAPVATASLPNNIHCADLKNAAKSPPRVLASPSGPVLVSVRSIADNGQPIGELVLVHDLSIVARRSAETRKYIFYLFVGLGFTIALITVIIAQLSWRGWVHGLRAVVRGEGLLRPGGALEPPELRPIARDVRALIRELETARRARDEDQVAWAPETLRTVLHDDLRGQEVIVVSNREPYIHERAAGRVRVTRPASGLVTALEPVMRACSGTWIAHGGGSGDRETVDRHDRLDVPPPPETPAYQLRRVWLTEQEESGYYYGFANEGLWPLCHIAHVRPVFRSADWEQYAKVNAAFAKAAHEEARSDDPIVLVHDYHLALVPRMLREMMPAATIITFWHIPWPNPEAFAICPWREELLDGLLGSSILGFHTQFHCNNFVDTVERLIEARVDRELFSVTHKGALTSVKRYPISVEWPSSVAASVGTVDCCRAEVRRRHGLPEGQALGVGIDRLDYTKGIEERLRAVERLLERRPEWVGRFTFVQIGAPTRARIEQYQQYDERVRALAGRLNERFAEKDRPPPVVLCIQHHQPEQVYEYYRAAEVCMVTSLPRRHEPGREGVRLRPRRRARRPDPEPVHRCFARAARGADREPLRHRPVRHRRCTWRCR
jgi:trehalose 6-phosphate synthase